MDEIINETNRFGQAKHGDLWADMTELDMWRIFGTVLLMGIIRKPTLHSYWTTSDLFSTPQFNRIIPRDLFKRQLGALHFVDNDLPQDSRPKLFKLGKVFDLIAERFSAVYHPGQHICIDESLVAWRGNLSMRQYIPSKRTRFGIKLFVLCDSANGYISRMRIYIGDEKDRAKAAGRSITENIVLTLIEGMTGLGHILFMDNYYNSPDLTVKLAASATHVCGTLRVDRKGVPKQLQKNSQGTKLKKGESTYFSNDKMLIGCWHDKKCINIISTLHSDFNMVDSGKRNRDGSTKLIPKPIPDYNKYMGGVDRSDQVMHYYDPARRAMKWYKKFFFHLLDVSTCTVNSRILFFVHLLWM